MGAETWIQGEVRKHGEGWGLLCLRLRLLGLSGWPDTVFIGPGGRILFIEFKAPGEKPRKLQRRIHNTLRRYGFHVLVVDDEEEGKRVLDVHFALRSRRRDA